MKSEMFSCYLFEFQHLTIGEQQNKLKEILENEDDSSNSKTKVTE